MPQNKTYPCQVILRKEGNTYLGAASRLIGNYHAQAILDDIKAGHDYLVGDGYKYFAYQLEGTTFIMLARAKTAAEACAMMDSLELFSPILIHFDTLFLSPLKPV